MKAYLIDPTTRTVSEVEYDGYYKNIYPLIGPDVDTFTDAPFGDDGDSIFVDDEGLINGNPNGCFLTSLYPQPLFGKGLVLGCDEKGNSTSPKISFEALRDTVTWAI